MSSTLVQSVDWLVIAPPTIVAVVGLVVLVADLFVDDAKKTLLGWVCVAGLAASALMLLPRLDGDRSRARTITVPTRLIVRGSGERGPRE